MMGDVGLSETQSAIVVRGSFLRATRCLSSMSKATTLDEVCNSMFSSDLA